MTTTGAGQAPVTTSRRTLLQRVLDALKGRRREQVLVLVNTTRGQRAVPVDLRDLR